MLLKWSGSVDHDLFVVWISFVLSVHFMSNLIVSSWISPRRVKFSLSPICMSLGQALSSVVKFFCQVIFLWSRVFKSFSKYSESFDLSSTLSVKSCRPVFSSILIVRCLSVKSFRPVFQSSLFPVFQSSLVFSSN